MTTTTETPIAAAAGPRALLAQLLVHPGADVAALAAALHRELSQVERALARLARRGLVVEHSGRYEVVAAVRPTVADYAEGALPLRGLVAGR